MSRLVLEIGQTSIEVPLKGTVQQIRTVVRRYAKAQGIDMTNLTDVQVGEAVLRRIAREIRQTSLDVQRRELIAAQEVQIEAVLQSDNNIVDEG